MMRPCTTDLNLSDFVAMGGMYSLDTTPTVPVGTETIIHVKPVGRQSWRNHAIHG